MLRSVHFLLPAVSLQLGRASVAFAALSTVIAAQPAALDPAAPKPELPLSSVAEVKGWAVLAEQALPVLLEGVVTVPAPAGNFFLHDGSLGIHVAPSDAGKPLNPGDRVRVSGVTRRGAFAPSIEPREIVRLGRGELPEPRRANFNDLASGRLDGQWLQLAGVVCDVGHDNASSSLDLLLSFDGRRLRVVVKDAAPLEPEALLDAQVRVRGAASGSFNRHRQLVEPVLRVPGPEFLTRLRPPPTDPFAVPLVPLTRLLGFSLEVPNPHRVRIRATVTRSMPGNVMFVREGNLGLKVKTREPALFPPGAVIEAAGFGTMAGGSALLENAVCRVVGGGGEAPTPVRAPWPQLLDGTHSADLVSLRARLVDWLTAGGTTTLILQTETQLFRATLPSPEGRNPLPERNSIVEVTGICEMGEAGDAWRDNRRTFLLLLSNSADIALVERADWWTAERLGRALAVVMLLLGAGVGWVWSLRQQVRRKAAVIEQQSHHAAVLEERSRIARDLHDTLEQGLTGLSLQLKVVEMDSQEAPHQVGAGLEAARQMLRQSRALAHKTIRELRTDDVARHPEPLATGLQRIAETWKPSGIDVVVTVEGPERTLTGEAEHHLIGIAGEAVTNAVKHGRATRVRVRVRSESDVTRLDIEDNGTGFDPALTGERGGTGGLGLVGMRERVEAIGGTWEIAAQPAGGTLVAVTAPVRARFTPRVTT